MQMRGRKRAAAERAKRYNRMVKRWLICCLPVGLIMMWTNSCTWDRLKKTLCTLCVAIVAIALVSVRYQAPEYEGGGTKLVSLTSVVEVYGPPVPAELPTSYSVAPPSIITSIPTQDPALPTSAPVYVYYNTMGKYYHSAYCKYVTDNSIRSTVYNAAVGGLSRCPDCDAPGVYD